MAGAPGFTLADTALLGWKHLLVIATCFVLREIEISFALAAHVSLDAEQRKVTILSLVSKKDPRAIGCERSWTYLCTAGQATRLDCPYHAAVAQTKLSGETFGIPFAAAQVLVFPKVRPPSRQGCSH